jgi:hypothetical protein
LPRDLEGAVGPEVAESDAGHLGHAEPGVEHQQHDRPIAHRAQRQQASEEVVGDGLDDLVRDTRPAQPAEGGRLGQALRCQPVAEHPQRPDVASDANRGEGRAELDEPRPQFGRIETIDRPIWSKRSDEPDGDHPVPLDRPRRCALGGLRGEEQLDRTTERQVPARVRCPQIRVPRIRCPKISRVRCPNHVIASWPTEVWTRSSRKMLWFSRSRSPHLVELAGEGGFEPPIP